MEAKKYKLKTWILVAVVISKMVLCAYMLACSLERQKLEIKLSLEIKHPIETRARMGTFLPLISSAAWQGLKI